MSYEVGVVDQFEAAHRLQGDFGPATRLHGHTYKVEVSVQGAALRSEGTLCDIGDLQDVVHRAVYALNYQELSQVSGLAGINTTAEVVARYLFDRIAPHMRGKGLDGLTVRVWESPQAYALYGGTLD